VVRDFGDAGSAAGSVRGYAIFRALAFDFAKICWSSVGMEYRSGIDALGERFWIRCTFE
jgi:hypothetical protein